MSKKKKNGKNSKSTLDGTKHSGVNGQPKIGNKEYEAEIFKLQVELVKLQDWVKATNVRIVIIFEGRDAAGKGGMIKRIMERVSPRIFRVVALPSPTERQKTQLHAQRYIERLPAGGEVVISDRSWYNRAGVEYVMGFCTEEEHREFLRDCPIFEGFLVSQGIIRRPVGEPISIVVGKSGLGWGIGVITTDDLNVRVASDPVKREGDGKAPAGVFALGTAFGYASQALRGLKMPYLNLTPSIECVDDPGSKYYNRIVDRSVVAPDWTSSEHMRNAGESYRWGIVIDHNRIVTEGTANPPEPKGGSCVFLHIWHRHDQGTAGCTATSQIDIETLLIWLHPARKPLLVQLPEPTYERLINHWILPELIKVPPR